jgi:hypothetical protein
VTPNGTQRLLRDIACVERLAAAPDRTRQDPRARLEAILGPGLARTLLVRVAPATGSHRDLAAGIA